LLRAIGLRSFAHPARERRGLLQSRYVESQQSLRAALYRLERLSMTDSVTEIANRRAFDYTLDREWNRAQRSREPLSLLLIDLDFFKNLNDRYGHVSGDECLVRIAHTLRAALPREVDVLARYGGEEFAAILPGTDRAGAKTVARKMLVPLPYRGMLAAAVPNMRAIEAISETADVLGYYIFAAGQPPFDAAARMFAPRAGIPEESATGMGAGLLAAFLHDRAGRNIDHFTFDQGSFMR
jgi:diguanylate cyclase (GGDEF)-like protein